MRKILSWIMALGLTAAALTGCGQAQTQTAAVTTAAETAVSQTSPEETTAAETSAKDTAGESAGSDFTLRVGSLKGPTSIGLAELMDKAARKEALGSYEFTMVTAADELLAKMVSGDLDIALVPANMAGLLFQKTNHSINVIDINTLGVLYVVSSDESIQSVSDLKGKTVYLTGKGTTPDYVLQFLLSANSLSKEDVTLEYKSEAAEVAAVLKEQPGAIGLLPQPFVTVAMAQNDQLKMVLDLTKEWELRVGPGGGSLVTGVTVCRGDLFTEHEEAVRVFMAEHQASAKYATDHVPETAKLVAEMGIIEKASVAEKAIPYCSITYIDGDMMKSMLDGYLTVLHDLDPKTVGGSIPTEEFYYIP